MHLLTPEFLRKLEHLTLASKKFFAGRIQGERKSTKKGAGVEFTDYRNYVAGDDLRYVDWNNFARSENLFLKLFVEEEDLKITIILDATKSMAFGLPSKFEYAKALAASLSYIGLVNMDRVGIVSISEDRLHIQRHAHGRNQFSKLADFLNSRQCEGGFSGKIFEEVAGKIRQKGLLILISDLMWEEGVDRPFKILRSSGYEVSVLHVLSPQEIDPSDYGDWKFVDSESGSSYEVSLGKRTIGIYKKRLNEFVAYTEQMCRNHEMTYSLINTKMPIDEYVTRSLRKIGLVE